MHVVSDEEAFVLSDGRKINSLDDLCKILHKLDPGIFNHHVNSEKNDFSAWIRGVFKDGALSDEVAGMTEPKDIIRAVKNKILKDNIKHKEKKELKGTESPKFDDVLKKEKQILEKELEINLREKKIEEIEQRIEAKLGKIQDRNSDKTSFFSKDFIQGLFIGALVVVLVWTVYWKFFT